ncbi:FG-GAP repeat domain-containing protein [Microbulbifer agarilyticus]|uniref:FG-GAP repeat domain-containing protein n=1 Tax=Microbulbifer agarilyticus TaxID=260552 RepID=UPI0009877954|nr:VCBS repeat-containing protein [Microbulbifer agarilyticus]
MFIRKSFLCGFLALPALGIVGFAGCNAGSPDTGVGIHAGPVHFSPVSTGFFKQQKNLRKWGAPTVADLDQDGWPDVLLNEHGFGVRVIWNNAGTYSDAQDLLMGDSHGTSVADFDRDGLLEVIVARGGGSGKNARNSIIYRVGKDRTFTRIEDFPEPLLKMRGRTVQFADLDHDGTADLLNFAFPSLGTRGDSENYLYRNAGDGTLALAGRLQAKVRGDGQRTLITDIDQDGRQDLLLYGHGPISLHRGNGDFQFSEVTAQRLPEAYTHVTSALELDFDNDGDFDIVLSRAHGFESGDTFYDAETQVFGFYARRGGFAFDLESGDLLQLVNYQSPWPHKQLYLGESAYKLPLPGETHSGKTLNLVNSDSLGWPDMRERQGLHAGYIGNRTWRIGGDIWSPTSGVVKGITKKPGLGDATSKEPPANVLLENRDGVFVDVSAEKGLGAGLNSTGVVVADFDNDGYQDLVFIQRGNLISAIHGEVFLNQGGERFARAESHNVASGDLGAWGLGGIALDFNKDGKQDVLFGNERGKWHLHENATDNGNRSLTIDVAGPVLGDVSSDVSGGTVLDGLVKVTACGNRQIRRVGESGAGYERGFNRYLHFGLGDCVGPVQVDASWTNGRGNSRVIDGENLQGNFTYVLQEQSAN